MHRQRLSHLHTRHPDLRIKHDEADRRADKDEVRFELGHGSREEERYVGAGLRGLADLKIKLQVVHSADRIRFINLYGQRISLVVIGKAFLLRADMDNLVTVRPPPCLLYTSPSPRDR